MNIRARIAPLSLALLLAPAHLSAQLAIGGRAGMTLSSISAGEAPVDVSQVAGIHAGITADLRRGGVGLVLSGAYSERGTGFAPEGLPDGVDVNVTYRLSYIDVGAFGKVPLGGRPYLLAGPTAGLRLSCTASASAGGSTQNSRCGDSGNDPFKRFDFGISGGAGMSFDAIDFDMVVEVLYNHGIRDISDVEGDSARNRGFVVRIGVDLGGRSSG